MDSMRQMQLLRELEDRLGCSLPTTMFDEFTTIEQIVDTLLSDAYTKISPKIAEFIDQEINSFKVREKKMPSTFTTTFHITKTILS